MFHEGQRVITRWGLVGTVNMVGPIVGRIHVDFGMWAETLPSHHLRPL